MDPKVNFEELQGKEQIDASRSVVPRRCGVVCIGGSPLPTTPNLWKLLGNTGNVIYTGTGSYLNARGIELPRALLTMFTDSGLTSALLTDWGGKPSINVCAKNPRAIWLVYRGRYEDGIQECNIYRLPADRQGLP